MLSNQLSAVACKTGGYAQKNLVGNFLIFFSAFSIDFASA
jgi:hypothetical protein